MGSLNTRLAVLETAAAELVPSGDLEAAFAQRWLAVLEARLQTKGAW
jgi:hypothetical protein